MCNDHLNGICVQLLQAHRHFVNIVEKREQERKTELFSCADTFPKLSKHFLNIRLWRRDAAAFLPEIDCSNNKQRVKTWMQANKKRMREEIPVTLLWPLISCVFGCFILIPDQLDLIFYEYVVYNTYFSMFQKAYV